MQSITTRSGRNRVIQAFSRSDSPVRIIWLVAVALVLAVGWLAIAYPTQFLTGLIVGSLYAIAALGLTMIYSITKVPHFAHGDAMMLSAFVTYFALTGVVLGSSRGDTQIRFSLDQLPGASETIWKFSFGYGFLLAMLVSARIATLLFLAINRYVYRPLQIRGAGVALIAVASLGVAIAMRGFIMMIWGASPRGYSTGVRQTVEVWRLPRIVADQIFILLVSVTLAAAVSWYLYRTRSGKAMRAMSDNADLARLSGIVVTEVNRHTWKIGGMLIVVAGTLLALQAQLSADLGFILLLPIFASAILGGIGSPHGALVGGLIVGVVSEVTVGMGIVEPGYKIAVAFAVMIVVIIFRPWGIFGVKV